MTKKLDTERLRALYVNPEQPAEELACLIPDLLDEIDDLRGRAAHSAAEMWGQAERAENAEAKLERVREIVRDDADLILGRALVNLMVALDRPC